MRITLRIFYFLGIKILWLVLTPVILWKVRRSQGRIAITCDRTDGIGAQIHGRLSTLAFAQEFGIEYVHSKFSDVLFMSDSSQVEKWNNLFDFSESYRLVDSTLNLTPVDSMRGLVLRIIFCNPKKRPYCFQVIHGHPYTDRFPESISRIQKVCREIVGRHPQISKRQARGEIITAVHLRVGLENETAFTPDRLSSRRILELKSMIARNLAGGGTPTVFTPRRSKEIDEIFHDGFFVDDKSDVFDVFVEMITAENLFLAKSSLSYSAGILNSHHVFYETMWHPPLKTWQAID